MFDHQIHLWDEVNVGVLAVGGGEGKTSYVKDITLPMAEFMDLG